VLLGIDQLDVLVERVGDGLCVELDLGDLQGVFLPPPYHELNHAFTERNAGVEVFDFDILARHNYMLIIIVFWSHNGRTSPLPSAPVGLLNRKERISFVSLA
jgi:hypothetical protein